MKTKVVNLLRETVAPFACQKHFLNKLRRYCALTLRGKHFKFLLIMELFELVVGPNSYEMHCSQNREKRSFSTLLAAFAYAQNAMSKETAEMVVYFDAATERVPLYRMMA